MADAKKRRVDTRDLTVLTGLTLLTVGAWFVTGPAALAICGAVLVLIGLYPPKPSK